MLWQVCVLMGVSSEKMLHVPAWSWQLHGRKNCKRANFQRKLGQVEHVLCLPCHDIDQEVLVGNCWPATQAIFEHEDAKARWQKLLIELGGSFGSQPLMTMAVLP